MSYEALLSNLEAHGMLQGSVAAKLFGLTLDGLASDYILVI